jgi:hypothetical protein
MKEAVLKLEESYAKKDDERLAACKREILEIQAKIDRIT